MSNWALEGKKQIKIFEYDFAKEGGAVGNITLRGGSIPKGAVVTSGMILGITDLTSGGSATCALALVGADDVRAAADFDTINDGTMEDVVPVGTAATAVLTVTDEPLVMAVAVAALTGGAFRVALEFYMLDDV